MIKMIFDLLTSFRPKLGTTNNTSKAIQNVTIYCSTMTKYLKQCILTLSIWSGCVPFDVLMSKPNRFVFIPKCTRVLSLV